MIDDRVADHASAAGNHVEHARWQAALFRVLSEFQKGERGVGCRLDDDRVSARQRRRDLPDREHEREVPRSDRADDTNRLAQRVRESVVGDGNRVAGDFPRPAREVVKALRGRGGVDELRFENRLAVVDGLDAPDLVRLRGEHVRDPPEHFRAVARLHLLPLRPRFHLRPRGLHRRVDVFRTGGCNIRDLFLGRRVGGGERLAGLGVGEVTVDEELGLHGHFAATSSTYGVISKFFTYIAWISSISASVSGACSDAAANSSICSSS